MTPTFKRGSTLRALLQFTEDEWAAIWPWGDVSAQARQGAAVHSVTVTVDDANRRVTLTADTSDWLLRLARIDLRVVRGGMVIYIPGTSDLQVSIGQPVTEAP